MLYQDHINFNILTNRNTEWNPVSCLRKLSSRTTATEHKTSYNKRITCQVQSVTLTTRPVNAMCVQSGVFLTSRVYYSFCFCYWYYKGHSKRNEPEAFKKKRAGVWNVQTGNYRCVCNKEWFRKERGSSLPAARGSRVQVTWLKANRSMRQSSTAVIRVVSSETVKWRRLKKSKEVLFLFWQQKE